MLVFFLRFVRDWGPVSNERPAISDSRLGIERHFGGLKRQGETVKYAVPGYFSRFATAQRVIWGQFQEHRPERLVAAISERCRLAVSDEETISQTPSVGHTNSNKRGHNLGMSI